MRHRTQRVAAVAQVAKEPLAVAVAMAGGYWWFAAEVDQETPHAACAGDMCAATQRTIREDPVEAFALFFASRAERVCVAPVAIVEGQLGQR